MSVTIIVTSSFASTVITTTGTTTITITTCDHERSASLVRSCSPYRSVIIALLIGIIENNCSYSTNRNNSCASHRAHYYDIMRTATPGLHNKIPA